MIHRVAEYTVREGSESAAQEAIGIFVRAVNAAEPRTRYQAYRRSDSRQFIHFMAFPGEADEERHRRADYTLRFVAVLYPLCEEPPRFTLLAPQL